MEEILKEIGKLGTKVYTLSNKIKECERSGMSTRVTGYVQDLEKTIEKLTKLKEDLYEKVTA